MSELLSQLQQLGDGEIDDLSIAHDASEEIVALRLRVAELVEALERLIGDVERATHVESGGTPWLKEKMAEIDYARAALAAHRKQGGEA